jgi:N-sulfoglucosamine sulfohydrolase
VNLVLLHTHDSGRYLDPAESPRPLPAIARFASSGVSFRNAYSAAPTCSPSRSALLTGLPPQVNGMTGLAHRGFRLESYSHHLVSALSGSGVETVLCGVQHVAPVKADIGYERILDDPADYFTQEDVLPAQWDRNNTGRVIEFLKEKHSRPFFLSFGLLSTHRPFPTGEPPVPPRSYPRPPSVVPDTPATRLDMERFTESLETVDKNIGRVIEAIESSGLWEETAILLTTDHGPAFPGMKGTLFDGGIGVALVLRIPGVAENGRVDDALVSQMDLYPTICELFGIEPGPNLEGRSLMPLLRGESTRVRDEIFAVTNYHANYEPARAIRTERFKLLRRYADTLRPRPANVDDSPSKREMAEAGYFDQLLPREQLFDLVLDPTERVDFKAKESHADVYKQLGERLDAWMAATEDPIRVGRMPRPKGSRLNRQDAWSAEEPTVE